MGQRTLNIEEQKMHASHCVLTCGGIAIISQNFPQTLLHGTQDAVLKSVNWLCIFMSCWLVCDLLTFATVSCIAFDVSVIINEAPLFPLHQALLLLLLYISCHESFFVHFFSDQIVTCLDGSDLGKFGLVLGALIKTGQWRRYKMCRGRGISDGTAGRSPSPRLECSNEKSELSVPGTDSTGSRPGMHQQSH